MPHGKLIVNNINGKIATVNPDGSGYTVIADAASPYPFVHDYRLAIAIDDAAGRMYWTQLDSLYLSTIQERKA